MKLPTHHSRKTASPIHLYIFLAVLVVLSAAIYPSYLVATSYNTRSLSSIASVDAAVFDRLRKHSVALDTLRMADEKVSQLANDKIATESVLVFRDTLLFAFLHDDYDSVSTVSASLDQEIARARNVDAETFAELQKRLDAVSKKRDDYKKLGVNSATVSAGIASASADLQEKRYLQVPSLLTLLENSLESLLAQKKEADRKAALAAVAVANIAPQSTGGITYERKSIGTTIGSFSVDILTVDLNRVKVKTFTASDSDCATNCPLKPLASYVTENGGIAGINGTYFCPADYSSCSSKVNAFDLLVFDYKSKHYVNSAQNQYSVNPLVSFYGDGAHYYTQALGFGRDTSAYGAISNFPTLIHNGGVAVNGGLDAKSSGTKTIRGGIGFRGKTLWAVMTRGATVPDTAYVFQSLGAEFAMNLDGGGSAALYFGGYKVGPGRQLPNAIVFTN